MAASLEQLLAEEGFRGRKSAMRSRASFKAEAATMPSQGQQKKGYPLGPAGQRTKNERTRTHVSRYSLRSELPRSDSGSSRRSRDNLVKREKFDVRSKTEDRGQIGRRGPSDVLEGNKKLEIDSADGSQIGEIVEVGEEEEKRFKDKHSDNSERSEKCSKGKDEKERCSVRKGKDVEVDKRQGGGMPKYKKSVKQSEPSYESSVRGSKNAEDFEDDQRPRPQDVAPVPVVSELALDEVAVQAIVSILNGYVKRFLKDEEIRAMVRNNCFSSLNFNEVEEGHGIERKVITNLEQAIETVAKAAEEDANPNDLTKASLQLNVITGLSSNDLRDGYTSGIPNSRLSACAHLYLSVIYKLQKKDRVSAKHLLEVFCDSPFLARTRLLPELWDQFFFPHLSHLKVWHNQEADSLLDTPSKTRKLELLDKVYNEILDSGTYQFAIYYKDWLTEGVEAPSFPSINIPSMSVPAVQLEGSQDHSLGPDSPSALFSPQPMVSKKLYEDLFGRSIKPGVQESEDMGETDKFDNGESISDASAIEVKETLTHCSEMVKYLDQDTEMRSFKNAQDNKLLPDHELLSQSKAEWKLVKAGVSPKTDLNDDSTSNCDTKLLNAASSHTKANKLILMTLAKSLFEPTQVDSGELVVSSIPSPDEPIIKRTNEGIHGSYEYFDEESFFASTPQDFVCPLTGRLFGNPVTLETGQTFEREAIKEWFNEGNRTCPVTGKTLECSTVPFTNFILKRIIDGWKLERYSHLLAFASQVVPTSGGRESEQTDSTAILVVEKLLTTFSRDERSANAKHLFGLGGLEFLLRRFKFGNLEQRTRVAALLSCCIEADSSCRHQIARQIDKRCLFELLCSKLSKSRRISVFLLTELVCLRRRKYISSFLSGLQKGEIVDAMRSLLVYLQTSSSEQRPSVAVLLLHLDLLVEPHKYSIYREEAVDAIAIAMEGSLTNKKLREKACNALLVLGGRFSDSGKLLTESWTLKQAGFSSNCNANSGEDDLLEEFNSSEDEEQAIKHWLRNLLASLLGRGRRRSFLETISTCLGSGNLSIVKVCLITIAWMSYTLSSLSAADLPLPVFSALISALKQNLENGELVEHKVLASLSLLNFSKIPASQSDAECRALLMTIAEEIAVPLSRLVEVSWSAKELYAIISEEDV